MIDRVAVRFLLTGIGNTLLGIGIILGARQFVGEFAANLIGYIVVVPLSFLAHRNWSFRDTGSRSPAFMRFLVSIVLGYLANIAILATLLDAGHPGWIAQCAAIAGHVCAVYLLSRHFVFQHQARVG